ncbi:MAG: formylglycine-generating enzyme family protein [Polyangiaceae bacterium]
MRRFLVMASGIAIATSAAAGCSLFVDLGDLTGGDDAGLVDATDDFSTCSGSACDAASGADVGASDGSVVVEAGPCDNAGTAGPRMVLADGFCIDSTEVTNQNYADFLAAGFSGSEPPTCTWKTNFLPDTSGSVDSDCTPGNVDVSTHPNFPISCVDWCDAWTYCKWAGKNICANVNGSSLAYSDSVTTSSEWYLACATPAKNTYSTGTTYDGGCNLSSSSTVSVGSDTKCVGGYPGLLDMAGNVEEWADSCDSAGTDDDGGAWNDNCHEMGDCFNYSNVGAAHCNNADSDRRGSHWADVGFRCCAPLP